MFGLSYFEPPSSLKG